MRPRSLAWPLAPPPLPRREARLSAQAVASRPAPRESKPGGDSSRRDRGVARGYSDTLLTLLAGGALARSFAGTDGAARGGSAGRADGDLRPGLELVHALDDDDFSDSDSVADRRLVSFRQGHVHRADVHGRVGLDHVEEGGLRASLERRRRDDRRALQGV